MANVLVTGGSGFIGSSLVERLVKDGHYVRVLDNNSRGNARRLQSVLSDIDFIEGDIRDPSVTDSATCDVDTVFHLAYVNGTEFFYTMPDVVLDVALRGMINLLDSCKKHSVPNFILASSSEVYQSPPIVPTPESVPLIIPDLFNPRYSYGGGKILCELMSVTFGKKIFDRLMIFRPHNVYGPDMGWEHVIPQFSLQAHKLYANNNHKNPSFTIKGDGAQTRSFIHIDDFINGVMMMYKSGENQSVYHIGNPEEITIINLARKICNSIGLSNVNFVTTEAPSGETSRRCPDISKISSLGFRPVIPIDKGLNSTVSWYSSNADLSLNLS